MKCVFVALHNHGAEVELHKITLSLYIAACRASFDNLYLDSISPHVDNNPVFYSFVAAVVSLTSMDQWLKN